MSKIVSWANEVRKALVAAASIAATIQATSGVPTDVKAIASEVVAVLAVFGIVYKVSNTPSE